MVIFMLTGAGFSAGMKVSLQFLGAAVFLDAFKVIKIRQNALVAVTALDSQLLLPFSYAPGQRNLGRTDITAQAALNTVKYAQVH